MRAVSVGTRRERIDRLLVERGLAPSREKAQAAIMAGLVSCAGSRIAKPGTLVHEDAEIAVARTPRFVGRGGEKLEGAIENMGLEVASATALDVGASTGGFTDCLLQRGASRVVAIDVGHGQLDWKLRNDPRVIVAEGVNARYLDPSSVPGPFDLIVVDVSFISLRLVLPVLFPLVREDATTGVAREPCGVGEASRERLPGVLALVKPQFEARRGEVGRGGVVRDPEQQIAAIVAVAASVTAPPPLQTAEPRRRRAAERAGTPLAFGAERIVESSLRGAEGNREFFVYFRRGGALEGAALEAEVRRIVRGGP